MVSFFPSDLMPWLTLTLNWGSLSFHSNADTIPPIDECSQYESCDECISSDPDCQWCPFEPVSAHADYSVIGSDCPALT